MAKRRQARSSGRRAAARPASATANRRGSSDDRGRPSRPASAAPRLSRDRMVGGRRGSGAMDIDRDSGAEHGAPVAWLLHNLQLTVKLVS
eukprot:COSAG05_NODE_561_length_8675_cov_3.694846_6_plen_90_part_00